MRILHVASVAATERVGGAEAFVEDLASEQARSGHEVAIATLSRVPGRMPDLDSDRITRFGLGPSSIFYFKDWDSQPGWKRKLYKIVLPVDPRPARRLISVIAHFHPDVVNTHSMSELPPMTWRSVKRTGVPLVHTLHDFTSLCSNGALFHEDGVCKGHRWVCRGIASAHRMFHGHVDLAIGVGSDILARHADRGFFSHLPEHRRAVVWNALPAPALRDRMERTGPIRFGYLGRIESSKGAAFLLSACAQLPPDGWTLTMAGRAPDGIDAYRQMAGTMPVIFPGPVDADAFYSTIDCLIVPALWPEAFGRTVSEALIRRIPVIGSDIGGIGEQVRAWQAGWLFPPGDRAALVAQMTDLIVAPDRLPLVPEHPAIRKRLSLAAVADEYQRLYGQISSVGR